MSANSLSEDQAFSAGASLWVLQNKPELFWWQKIDFGSKYLLTDLHLKKEKIISSELLSIIDATNIKMPAINTSKNYTLIGTEDHFLNKWLLVWSKSDETEFFNLLEKISKQLQVSSIRFFSNSDLATKLQARPWASLINIAYIENT